MAAEAASGPQSGRETGAPGGWGRRAPRPAARPAWWEEPWMTQQVLLLSLSVHISEQPAVLCGWFTDAALTLNLQLRLGPQKSKGLENKYGLEKGLF